MGEEKPKRCRDCGHKKPLSEFYPIRKYRNSTKVYYSSYCKDCHRKRSHADYSERQARRKAQKLIGSISGLWKGPRPTGRAIFNPKW